jgi:hypothetical protein
MVDQAFALEPVANPHFAEQLHRAPLEHSGADSFFAVLSAAVFEDDRVDSLQIEKMGKHQTRGTRADNSDLGACLAHDLISC